VTPGAALAELLADWADSRYEPEPPAAPTVPITQPPYRRHPLVDTPMNGTSPAAAAAENSPEAPLANAVAPAAVRPGLVALAEQVLYGEAPEQRVAADRLARRLLEAAAAADDIARCALCDCTEDRPCPGGCAWVPGGGLIDLCSACAIDEDCGTAGCGTDEDHGQHEPGAPDRYGWISARIHGTGLPPVWYCSPRCHLTSIGRQAGELAAAELSLADLLAAEREAAVTRDPVTTTAASAVTSSPVTIDLDGGPALVLLGAVTDRVEGRLLVTGHAALGTTVRDGWHRITAVSGLDEDIPSPEVQITTRLPEDRGAPCVLTLAWTAPTAPAGGDVR
jgi:hypothetical protein